MYNRNRMMFLHEALRPFLGQGSLLEYYFDVDEDSSEMEIPSNQIEWTWDKGIDNDFFVLLNNNRDVQFHRDMSGGTAVVRGTQPMSNDQYYWEVKMITRVYGTDMMVGVGTSEASINQVYDRYISLLGNDNKTWGLSYTGSFHHNGRSRDYATRFGIGSVIGIHLDMWHGTLSFYKDGKYLGIASRGLKGKTLYAMASSTAAGTGMRIVRSCSFPSSLQFICCTKLRELIPDEKNVLRQIHLPPGLRIFLENNLGWLLESRCTESDIQVIPYRSKVSLEICPDDYSITRLHIPELDGLLIRNVYDDKVCRAPYTSNCLASRMFSQNPTVHSESPQLIVNVRNGNIQEDCSSSVPQNPLRHNIHSETEHHYSVSESSKSDTEDELEGIEELSDREVLFGSEAKWRSCSYNYTLGLSDSDSE
ncbi:SPRY domain-containing SOCS box protein 3 [Trichonephila inaurata madagascariensis]|uniref:SPRY domain-containing SOCS box protein 3 n=1 Tax=Trichonephila inaurata madagascariensis TaxID=2747483 RepID=A0A8X6YD42_9ARAC|nr:SPRY domain-containing SOCS box protein 3 [Trichonephila inaurata madagascariensis]